MAGFTIGRDLGPFGTIFRVVSGAVAVWFGGAELVQDPAQAQAAAGFLLAAAALYLLIHRLYRLLPITSRDPFVATVVALAPAGVLHSSIFPARGGARRARAEHGRHRGAERRVRRRDRRRAAHRRRPADPAQVGPDRRRDHHVADGRRPKSRAERSRPPALDPDPDGGPHGRYGPRAAHGCYGA